ncbi:MAG: hypothetical protein ACLFP4_02625 [Spirochaetales bacterium]
MHTKRYLILAFLLSLASVLVAETVAVGVRPVENVEFSDRLSDLVEQGAMDYLFGSGHIVFDLSVDPSNQFYSYLALDQSRRGGAAVTILMDVNFDTVAGKGVIAESIELIVLDAISEEILHEGIVSSTVVEDYERLDAETLAERVGGIAARDAVDSIFERRPE